MSSLRTTVPEFSRSESGSWLQTPSPSNAVGRSSSRHLLKLRTNCFTQRFAAESQRIGTFDQSFGFQYLDTSYAKSELLTTKNHAQLPYVTDFVRSIGNGLSLIHESLRSQMRT